MLITIFTLVILLMSVILHELAHGYTAFMLGDSTAKYAGRLTLNPLSHLDLFGSFLVPLFLFISTGHSIGWAKPVPINPYNFKDQKNGMLKVSLAGPLSNFLVAILFGLIIRFIPLNSTLIYLFSIIVFYNLLLGLFNIIPIPPLDGSHILFSLLPEKFYGLKAFIEQYSFILLMIFIFFGINLLFPIAIRLYTLLVG